MVCQICFQPNRKTRFSTSRLEICQWCINEIGNAALSPHQIWLCQELTFREKRREMIKHEIQYFECQIRPAPALDEARMAQIDTLAMQKARQTEGVLTFLYQSFFNESERLAKARGIAESLRAKLITDHREKTGIHAAQQATLFDKIADLKIQLLNVATAAAEDAKKYLAAALAPLPTKSKDERTLRAHALGLVNEKHEQVPRPDNREFESIKHSVREQDGYKCVCCGKKMAQAELHVHHIIPLYKFGTNCTTNLVTLCYSCHNKQHPGITVSRNQPIRRSRTVKEKSTVIASTPNPSITQEPEIPTSRKGWMDCPECLTSIRLVAGQLPECPECGWQSSNEWRC